MADNHVGLSRNVVHAILKGMSRGFATVVNAPLLCQPSAIEDVAANQDHSSQDKNEQSIHLCTYLLKNDFFFWAKPELASSAAFISLPMLFVRTVCAERSTAASLKSAHP